MKALNETLSRFGHVRLPDPVVFLQQQQSPPPPPPRSLCTVKELDLHLTYAARKTFLGGFKPLTSVGEPMPHPKDLTDFWQQVELALKAIDPSVRPELLGHRAIDLLGPLILGPGGWALISKPDPFIGSWFAPNIPVVSAIPSGNP